jgi:hypothetical protein
MLHFGDPDWYVVDWRKRTATDEQVRAPRPPRKLSPPTGSSNVQYKHKLWPVPYEKTNVS